MPDLLHFTPARALPASFDVPLCKAQLAAMGNSFQDGSFPDCVIVCADHATAEWAKKLRTDAPRSLPSVALGAFTRNRITLGARGSDADNDLLKLFLAWLAERHELQVHDDHGVDLTAGLASAPDSLFD